MDLAEVTTSSALLAANQESSFPVFPAFVDIGATGFLAHGVQTFARHKIANLGVLRSSLHGGTNPRWLFFDGNLSIAGFNPK